MTREDKSPIGVWLGGEERLYEKRSGYIRREVVI